MTHLLVIGGTKGLGRVFCESVSEAYEHVTIVARNPSLAANQAGRCRYVAADAIDPASLQAAMDRIVSAPVKVSHVVFFQQHRGHEQSWENKLACTLTATRSVIESLYPHFAAGRDQSIVFLTSTASRLVAEEQDDAYHAAKTALLGLCRYYACRLGPLGVRVNSVSPGTVLKPESQHHYLDNPELHGLFKRIIPLRRMGTAAEVASVINFLLSPAASFVTGQELVVDGGASLQSQESLARMLFNSAPRQPARF